MNLQRSKYAAVKTVVDGIKFDSKKEAKRYIELKLMERAGVISDLMLQVPFTLFEKNEFGRKIKYIADFTYWEIRSDGKKEYVVEDCKGYKTDVYRLKKRIMAEVHGIQIRES